MHQKIKFLFPGRKDSDESSNPELISVDLLESLSSSDSIGLLFFDSGTLFVWLIEILVFNPSFNGFLGVRLFDWFEFSISETFLFCFSLVGNFNSVCNSVLLLSVDLLN